MNYQKGYDLACRVAALFEPACAEVVIAGSLRRQQAEVGDIDLVARLPDDVEPRIANARLDALCVRLLRDGTLLQATGKKALGPKQKRFLVSLGMIRNYVDGPRREDSLDSAPPSAGTREHLMQVYIDLCAADKTNFGYRLALSTGNADWNHKLVTLREQGGLRPDTLVVANGYLFQGGKPLSVPTEEAFFKTMGLPFVPPQERNKERALEIIGQLRRSALAHRSTDSRQEVHR